jgi:hypothetical protein
MANHIQRYGFGFMCLLAWVLIFQDISTSISAQGDPPVASSQRFVVVLDGAAVKDVQTGFTWEQSPDVFYGVWTEAIAHCRAKTVGGQTAWRLPSIKGSQR